MLATMNGRIYLLVAFAATLLAGCSKDDASGGDFALEQEQLLVSAVGGVEQVNLRIAERWIASTDNPWITISPANGVGATCCAVKIDSALTAQPRRGVVRIQNLATLEERELVIEQEGFPYGITLSEPEVVVDNFDRPENRFFEVAVKSNVDFEVEIPEEAEWLSHDDYTLKLDRGERPREVKLRFKWRINTIPEERLAEVKFLPKRDVEMELHDQLRVKQEGADPIIPDTRAGDSIAVLNIARSLGTFASWESSDPMEMWNNVTLWDESMKGCTPEKVGRVKRAQFMMFNTKETLPFEVRYLTAADELYFFGNTNTFLLNIELGDEITELEQLRRLTIGSYGLISLPESFANLKNLEYLNISSNNLQEIPEVLTPENLPKLRSLILNANQRSVVYDLSNTTKLNLGGFIDEKPFPEHLLRWNELDTLVLSVNYLSGELPAMENHETWSAEEVNACDSLPSILIGLPKVLPTTKQLSINLNRLSGRLPDWLLYHPALDWWNPYSLIFPQEGRDAEGVQAGFDNEPVNLKYYYEHYVNKYLANQEEEQEEEFENE